MNTPKPCDSCEHLYFNAMFKDDPTDRAECLLFPDDEWWGNPNCPKYQRNPRLDRFESQ